MDVKAALAETRRAYEEAGAPAEAYAYLDDEDFEAWGDPPALTDDMPDPPSELEAPMGTTWIAATHCLFVGGPGTRLYYRAGNPQTRNCYTQNASITWLQRQFATTCRSNGEGIWWVLARV